MCGSLCHDTVLQRVSGLTVPWDAPPSCIKWWMFQGGWNGFAAQRNKLSCRPTLGVNYTQLAPDEKSCGSWRISVTPKASAGCKSTLAFGSSHEARRRMAAFSIQLTRKPHRTSEPRGPSPSGGISQPTHTSPYAPARRRRAVRGQGVLPLARGLSPSGGIFAALPMPLRAAGAQSERGTQSPILPRTMKRAPSKV